MERALLLKSIRNRSKEKDPVRANEAKVVGVIALDEIVRLKNNKTLVFSQLLRAEIEKLRQKEANLTALQAIRSHKKIKMDVNNASSVSVSMIMDSVYILIIFMYASVSTNIFFLDFLKIFCEFGIFKKAYYKQ